MRIKVLLLVLILALTLTACGSNTTPTPLPTVVLDSKSSTPDPAKKNISSGGGVTASGEVVSLQEAKMAFELGGTVKTVNVAVGDQVEAGKVLAELDNASIKMEVDQAQRNLQELTSPSSIAAAEKAVAVALQDVHDTQDKADGLYYPRASETLIKRTLGEIDLAKQALARAQDSWRQVARLEDGNERKAQALVAMTNAQLRLNDLISKYNWYVGQPDDIDSANVRANLAVAKAALQDAQWYLSALKGEQLPPEATGSKLAQLKQAKDNLAAAQDKLAKSRLVAPFSGTVGIVQIVAGEYATPGQVLVVLSDTTTLRVETTDLSERDVPKVEVGQAVNVYIQALNENISGRVKIISPIADTLGGDKVYKITIDLDTRPDGLRSGMSVDVQFQTSQ
jgi:multidrug efflux pump subunit AcrA (membrane-fusion protein)